MGAIFASGVADDIAQPAVGPPAVEQSVVEQSAVEEVLRATDRN